MWVGQGLQKTHMQLETYILILPAIENPLSIYLSFLGLLDLQRKTTKVVHMKANGSVSNIPGLQHVKLNSFTHYHH